MPLGTTPRFIRDNALPLTFVFCFALLCTHISIRANADNFPALFQSEFATLQGHPRHPEFQNRILAPSILWLLRDVIPASVSNRSVWFILRLFESVTAFATLYGVALGLTGGRLRAWAAVAFVSYIYCWTPLSLSENTSDFLDIFFTALFVRLTLNNRPLVLAIVVAVAATNRESAAFAGPIWLAVVAARHGIWPEQWRRYAPGVMFMVLAAAIVLGVRYGLAHEIVHQQIGMLELFRTWKWMLFPDGPMPMLLAMIFAVVVVLRMLPRPWTIDQKGLLAGAALCAAATFLFGIAGELRVWLPCCTIVALLGVTGSNGKSDGSWMRAFFGS